MVSLTGFKVILIINAAYLPQLMVSIFGFLWRIADKVGELERNTTDK